MCQTFWAFLRRVMRFGSFIFLCLILISCQKSSAKPDLTIAVATNFYETLKALTPRFEAESGMDISLVSGSSGKLYAQISQGAPYDIFLSADQWRAEDLVKKGFALEGSRYSYAQGQLVLWAPAHDAVNDKTLQQFNGRFLAMANPDLAPYGRAGKDVLKALGLVPQFEDKLVLGENVGQAFGFVQTGNAEMGFVALSQMLSFQGASQNQYWVIPNSLYAPIKQDVVKLSQSKNPERADDFMLFLKREDSRKIMQQHGYITP